MLLLVLVRPGGGEDRAAARCTPTDRKFIREAGLNMTVVGNAGREYLLGDAKAKDVIEDASRAAAIIAATSPSDPSLQRMRLLLRGMFTEYGRTIRARSKNRDAGPYMFRAYGLANFAHEILTEARPGLVAAGCDVSPLL